MKKLGCISAFTFAVLAAGAFAADNTTPAPHHPAGPPAGEIPSHEDMHSDWTLEEARKHAHERADKLDKMKPEEWAEHQKKRHEFREKWQKMTPEQKESWKKEMHEKREKRREEKKAGNAPKQDVPAPSGL